MKPRTYYDILGVSRDAALEEITAAKNALAKVYHPDANVHKDIDTTAFMQHSRSVLTMNQRMNPCHLSHTGTQRRSSMNSFRAAFA